MTVWTITHETCGTIRITGGKGAYHSYPNASFLAECHACLMSEAEELRAKIAKVSKILSGNSGTSSDFEKQVSEIDAAINGAD